MEYKYILEVGEEPNISRFSSTVRNPLEPSNKTYPDGLGNNISYEPRLAVPKANNKISDSISGATKLIQYSLSIMNDDGIYDDVETLEWFNTPVVLKRSFIENPTLDDFYIVMKGIVNYPIVTELSVRFIVNDVYRALSEQATNTFNITDYPNVFDNVKDRNIPIGYGSLKNVPLFRVDPSEFIALDKEYITTVTTVYDKDGNSIAFTFDAPSGQISAIDAVSADVTGITNNTIGEIIIKELEDKQGIIYNSDNWDLVEGDAYSLQSANVSFYFDGGTVRQLVDAVLKNDNAFLFTKNSGVLTIRQWGKKYNTHTIQSWKLTKFPTKDYQDAQRYFASSVVLKYMKDQLSGDFDNQLLTGDDSLADKTKRVTYPVDITSLGLLQDLSDRLLFRFGELSEIIDVASAESAVDINLLDLIELDVNINGRQFSTKTSWIVREVDPCQDTLVLEARSGFIIPEIIDGILSQPYFNGIDGVLSQPYSSVVENIDGVLSQPLIDVS